MVKSGEWCRQTPFTIASNGMFVSMGAVMLKLCDPFLDASLSEKGKIKASYVLQKGHLDFRCQI